MINLIPPDRKKRQKIRSKAYFIVVIYIAVTAIIVLGWVGQTTLNYIGKSNLGNKEAELATLKAQVGKNQDLLTMANFIQDRLNSSQSYQPSSWNELLDAVANCQPTDSTLTKLNITSDEANSTTITIGGQSSSRRSIILFKDKLVDHLLFDSATITSISDSSTDESATFSFTITVKVKETSK